MIKEFLQSGLIERYCLNDISEEEKLLVNQYALKYPEVEVEINTCTEKLSQKTSPVASTISNVKYKLMRRIYDGCAKTNFSFLPLMNVGDQNLDLSHFIKSNNLNPSKNFDGNMDMLPLASTIEIENAAVWIKDDFGAEVHTNEYEFIYVVEGSCMMDLDGDVKSYKAGDLIFIPPFVTHSAKVTSTTPMFALVQRQLLAQA